MHALYGDPANISTLTNLMLRNLMSAAAPMSSESLNRVIAEASRRVANEIMPFSELIFFVSAIPAYKLYFLKSESFSPYFGNPKNDNIYKLFESIQKIFLEAHTQSSIVFNLSTSIQRSLNDRTSEEFRETALLQARVFYVLSYNGLLKTASGLQFIQTVKESIPATTSAPDSSTTPHI